MKKKSSVKIYLSPGSLAGYQLSDLARDRRYVLGKMITSKTATYAQVIRRLNVLAIYNKNRNPKMTEKIRKDIAYTQRHYKSKYALSG